MVSPPDPRYWPVATSWKKIGMPQPNIAMKYMSKNVPAIKKHVLVTNYVFLHSFIYNIYRQIEIWIDLFLTYLLHFCSTDTEIATHLYELNASLLKTLPILEYNIYKYHKDFRHEMNNKNLLPNPTLTDMHENRKSSLFPNSPLSSS